MVITKKSRSVISVCVRSSKMNLVPGSAAYAVRIHEKSINTSFARWPREWESGYVKIHNYGGDDEDLRKEIKNDAVFRVIEVRSFKKSGKSSMERKRGYKDTLFIEPVEGSGLMKVYAGEAFVELVKLADRKFDEF